MTPRELVNAAMSGTKAERAPFLILDGGAWVVSQAKVSYADLIAQEDAGAGDVCKFFSEAGCDWYCALAGFGIAWLTALGCKADLTKTGGTIDVHPAFEDAEAEIPKLDPAAIRAKLIAKDALAGAPAAFDAVDTKPKASEYVYKN